MLGRILDGQRGVFLGAVRGTEWGHFLDYVHPSFFEVLKLRDLLAQGREMAGNLSDTDGFEAVRAAQTRALEGLEVPVRIGAPGGAQGESQPGDAKALGQRVLEVYFGQLFASDVAILDLRGGRWQWPPEEGAPTWQPRPLWIRWQPEFLNAVRDMYRGFYRDDEETFARGLAALRLEAAEDVLRAHFGEGDQSRVRFETSAFHSSFHEVFLRCRQERVSLHRNFLGLGVYLACLYDALEGLGPLDVRLAFERSGS